MTLDEVVVAVANRCGLATTDPRYASIDDRANEALHGIELYAGGEWDWLKAEGTVSTVANQDYLAFSTIATALSATGGIRRLDYVECAEGSGYRPATRYSKQQLRAEFEGSSAQPLVVAWAAEGQRLWLFPTPSAAVTLRVQAVKGEPDLTTGQSPLLPAIYHRIWIAATAALVLRSLQRYEEARVEEEAAAQGMSRMPGASTPYSGPGKIRRDWRN